MKTRKLILRYDKYSDANIAQISSVIIACLRDNPYFKVTEPSPEDFTALRSAYYNALIKSFSRDRRQIALKNQTKKELIIAMNQLARHINMLADNNQAKLVSSGFLFVKNKSKKLGLPKGFKITDGDFPGELRIMCDATANAKSYTFEFAYEEDYLKNNWTIINQPKRILLLSGFEGGKRVYARIKVIGRDGQGIGTDIHSRIVQ